MKKLYLSLFIAALAYGFAMPLAFADTVCETAGTTIIGYDNFGTLGGITRDASSFLANANENATAIEAWLSKTNSPIDDLTLELQGDAAGLPDGAAIASGSINGGTLSSSGVFTTVTLSVPVALTSGTRYWVVATRSGSPDGTNYYDWAISSSGSNRYTEEVAGSWLPAYGYVWTGDILCGSAAPPAATSTSSLAGYLPQKQEFLFMFGLITFLLSLIAFRTIFFTV